MPLDQLMSFCYSGVLVYSNIYLYKFLRTHEVKNTEILKNKKEMNQKRIRKRNFVPAGVGLIHSVLLICTYICKYIVNINQIVSLNPMTEEY